MNDFPNHKPSRRFTAIYRDHYESKAEQQMRYLDDLAELFLYPNDVMERNRGRFAKAWDKYVARSEPLPDYFTSQDIGAYISPFHLSNISKAYFIDIIRYKEYHYNPKNENISYDKYVEEIHAGDDKALLDTDKRVAFLIKWVLRAQPIQVDIPESVDLKSYQNQNEVWYVNEKFALFLLWHELGVRESRISPKEKGNLLHQFRYRPFEENLFALTAKKYTEMHR